MAKVKTEVLIGVALDWAVAKCAWVPWTFEAVTVDEIALDCHYSTDWAQGGPIIERERIKLEHISERHGWAARWPSWVPDGDEGETIPSGVGPTPLIAAMRCYCCSKLGDVIDIPEELCQ